MSIENWNGYKKTMPWVLFGIEGQLLAVFSTNRHRLTIFVIKNACLYEELEIL